MTFNEANNRIFLEGESPTLKDIVIQFKLKIKMITINRILQVNSILSIV